MRHITRCMPVNSSFSWFLPRKLHSPEQFRIVRSASEDRPTSQGYPQAPHPPPSNRHTLAPYQVCLLCKKEEQIIAQSQRLVAARPEQLNAPGGSVWASVLLGLILALLLACGAHDRYHYSTASAYRTSRSSAAARTHNPRHPRRYALEHDRPHRRAQLRASLPPRFEGQSRT
jgi:hypothetical protein